MKRSGKFLPLFFSLSAICFASVCSLAQETVRLPVPKIEVLPNGLTLVWFLNKNIPVIDLGLLLKSGSRDDPRGRSGTAEMVSRLLDRGAAGMNARQIAKAIEDLGASRYANADEDTFGVGMHGLAPDGPVLLELLSKLVLRPEFPEPEVKRVQARMLDGWEHLGDSADALAGLTYRRLITDGTGYGRGEIWSAAELRKLTRKDLVDYHKTHFTPKNTVLMIVGQVDETKFRAQIEKLFGGWSGEAPRHEFVAFSGAPVKHRKGQIVVVHRPGVPQAQVRMGFRAPLFQAPEHYPLVVANAMIGEYFNSRLNSLIRDKLGLTYGIGSGFSYNKDLAAFTISAGTKNESAGTLIRRTMEVMNEFKRGPLPAEEVKMAKEYLVGGFPLSTSTLGSVASRWLGGYVFDLGPEFLNEFVPNIEKTGAGEVSQAFSKSFDLNDWIIVVAGNAAEIEKSLKAAKFPTFRRVSVGDLR